MTRATIGTGGFDDLYVGARAYWVFAPTGGYGYTVQVPVSVVTILDNRRVQVKFMARNDRVLTRTLDISVLYYKRLHT